MTGQGNTTQDVEMDLRIRNLDVARLRPEPGTLFVCGVKVCPVCERPIIAAALRTGDLEVCLYERG